jgi:insertion element IS1 protein InsB
LRYHHSGKVLADVFGAGKDEVFVQLKALLEPFGIIRFYTPVRVILANFP